MSFHLAWWDVNPYDAVMRFDDLFAGLEAWAAAGAQRELWDEARDLARGELGRLDLGARLLGAGSWRLRLTGGHGCAGRLLRVEADCAVLEDSGRQFCVPLAAVLSAQPGPGPTPGLTRADSTLRAALRRSSRLRPRYKLLLTDGGVLSGRLIQVGQDHAEFLGQDGPVLLSLAGISAVVSEPGMGS